MHSRNLCLAGDSCDRPQTFLVFPKVRPMSLTFLSLAQLVRDDICMFMLRVTAVITLQIYTGIFLRTSIEFSIGTFIDI